MIENFKTKYQELAAKKRAELEGALDRGEVHDPVSAILVPMLISAAVSAASYVVSMAFAPKPPKQTIGKLQGSLQLQNSEQGIMIPEIYGAGPTASLVAGASPTYQNLTNTTGGANGSITKTSGANNVYNAGASHNTTVVTGQDAFIRVIRGTGFAAAGFFDTASPTGSGSQATGMIFGVAWHNAGPTYPVINGVGIETGNTEIGDTFTIEVRSGRFRLYKNSAEITTFGSAIPAQPASMWFGVIMYTSGAGVSNAKVQINSIGDPPNYAKGGIKVPAIIDWSSGIRKHVSVTQTQTGGKGFMGGRSQTTENITYDIDLGLTFARGPLSLLREYANADVMIDQTDTSLLLTGAYDPTTGADPDYDPELPPDPSQNYTIPYDRVNATIPFDGDLVGTGSIQGGGSNFAVYSGTETQDPDPTEESDVDAKHGTGSTTAHRGKARIVHTNFDLSRWGGIVPNMTAAWENPTLATMDDIYGDMCERVNVKAATSDYDWTGLSTIQPRGMLIAGRLYSPAEVIGSPDIQTVYNYVATEAEGQLIGWIEGAGPSATIADTEVGWMDSDGEVSDILPEVDTMIASEIGLAREVHVKYIDLDKEWEPNTQSDNRQITEGVSTEVVEVQLALLSAEARTAAQRKLYRDYVAGSVHKFTLPWTYLYLYPGYKITITRAEGFNHVLKLTSISGGVGVLECEGVAIEPAAFTQPAVGSIITGDPPPQAIPAMTVLTLLDTPLLRDGDETNNNGVGFYACGTPRTGVGQSWLGFALYRNRNSVWGLIGSSDLPGTIGTIVSVTGEVGIINPTNIVGGTFTSNVFTKTATSGWGNAGFFSSGSLIGDGYIEWTMTSTTVDKLIGLSTSDMNQDYTTIEYAWFTTATGAYDVFELGVSKAVAGTYIVGTVFKIERIGTTLTYYKNGASQRVVAGVTTSPLHVDVAVYHQSGTAEAITMAAAGVAVNSDPTVFDRASTITVDLYGTSASLSSSTEDGILADKNLNLALFGDMVSQFVTVSQVAGFPNRWTISVLLNGRRGTEHHVTDTFTDKRFVLIDEAVKFVLIDTADLLNNMGYRGVTSGQSLADAATVEFVWEGGTQQPYSIVNARGTRDSADSLLIEFEGRSRVGGGVRSYQAGTVNEEVEEYRVQILDGGSTTMPNGRERIMPVIVGMTQAALLESDAATKFTFVDMNSLIAPDPWTISPETVNARGFQLIEATGNYTEAKLRTTNLDGTVISSNAKAAFGIVPANFDWHGKTNAEIMAAAHIWISQDCGPSPGFDLSVTVYEYGVSKYTAAMSEENADTGRNRIIFAGRETRIYRNWTGSAGELVYSSPVEQTFPYAVLARCESITCVLNVVLTTIPFPKTIYSWTQQTEDGFTPGDPVEMDIWQHSRLVGPGVKTRVAL